MWVYRAEKRLPPTARKRSREDANRAANGDSAEHHDNSEEESDNDTVDETDKPLALLTIDFHPAYKLYGAFVQGISTEVRIPKYDGIALSPPGIDPVMNGLCKSMVFRPLRRPEEENLTDEINEDRIWAPVYANPEDGSLWTAKTAPAVAWQSYERGAQARANAAWKKFQSRKEIPSLWETREMIKRMDILAGRPPEGWSDIDQTDDRVTVSDYDCFVIVDVAENMDGQAIARTAPKRFELEEVQETVAHRELPPGGQDNANEFDAAAQIGLHLANAGFTEDEVKALTNYERERPSAVVKELIGQIELHGHEATMKRLTPRAREQLANDSVEPDVARCQRLRELTPEGLETLLAAQENKYAEVQKAAETEAQNEAPPDNDDEEASMPPKPPTNLHDADAILANLPADAPPADVVRALVNGCPPEKRVTEDQAGFLAEFTVALDTVYKEHRDAVK